MLTIEQLQELYSTGAHVFTESHLAEIALPALSPLSLACSTIIKSLLSSWKNM
jgi:hypothetical protein